MAAKELKTFSDIYNAVLEEVKFQSSDTTSLNRVKRDINAIYLNEVLPKASWYWARGRVDVVHENYLTGTATVTQDSVTVTLSSAPTVSRAGDLLTINGHAEIYRIRSHSASSTTVLLESKYTGVTSSTATYKIWNSGITLPVECLEPVKVWHDWSREPIKNLPDMKFLDLLLAKPTQEGRPSYYTITDYEDPTPFASISGLPALSTRASSGLVKTLVFATSVASYLEVGDRIQISSSSETSYNGEFIIESVSTTTMSYTGIIPYDESATADGSLTVKAEDDKQAAEVYRKLDFWPALNTEDTTIHVEYVKELRYLENDSDEPAIPLKDRIILLYGALSRAWARYRNPEESARNQALFEKKLSQMVAHVQSNTDPVKLQMSDVYLYGKRASRRTNWENF